jgi:hypothetical protein
MAQAPGQPQGKKKSGPEPVPEQTKGEARDQAGNYHAEEAKKRQGARTDLKQNIVEPVPQSSGKARDQAGQSLVF